MKPKRDREGILILWLIIGGLFYKLLILGTLVRHISGDDKTIIELANLPFHFGWALLVRRTWLNPAKRIKPPRTAQFPPKTVSKRFRKTQSS